MSVKIRTCTELIGHGQFKCCGRPAHLVVKYYNENGGEYYNITILQSEYYNKNGSWDLGGKVCDTLKMGDCDGNDELNFAVLKF